MGWETRSGRVWSLWNTWEARGGGSLPWRASHGETGREGSPRESWGGSWPAPCCPRDPLVHPASPSGGQRSQPLEGQRPTEHLVCGAS